MLQCHRLSFSLSVLNVSRLWKDEKSTSSNNMWLPETFNSLVYLCVTYSRIRKSIQFERILLFSDSLQIFPYESLLWIKDCDFKSQEQRSETFKIVIYKHNKTWNDWDCGSDLIPNVIERVRTLRMNLTYREILNLEHFQSNWFFSITYCNETINVSSVRWKFHQNPEDAVILYNETNYEASTCEDNFLWRLL